MFDVWGFGWVWVGLGWITGHSISSPGSGLGWVGSVIWWVELGWVDGNRPTDNSASSYVIEVRRRTSSYLVDVRRTTIHGIRIHFRRRRRDVLLYYIVNCFLFDFVFVLYIFDVIFSIAKGVQHDGRLPFWKPASVFAHYVCIVFAIGEMNFLLLLLHLRTTSTAMSTRKMTTTTMCADIRRCTTYHDQGRIKAQAN